jgi:demethylmenaquinone methyltransferase/2-methoxy-6-polyprenyl-1,4-benzoquinol methylase
MGTSPSAAPPVSPDPVEPRVDVRGMFDRIAGRYDAANRVMSAGIDGFWRRRAMAALLADLPEAARVLDLGAGTLDGALEIVRRRPQARVAAADFAREMLKVGRSKLGTLPGGPATRIVAHVADGHQLPYVAAAFDGAFSGFCVRNLTQFPVALAELRRVVRPGGVVAILEFFRPRRRRLFFDRLYNAHLLPLIGWAVTGDRAAYRYLPRSIADFLSRPEFEASLRQAGFREVRGHDLPPAGVASLVVGR